MIVDNGAQSKSASTGPWMTVTDILLTAMLFIIVVLIVIVVSYTGLSYQQLTDIANGSTTTASPQVVCQTSTQNLTTTANYTPVFDFNEFHSTDIVTAHGYAKLANIMNYPATHNQAISQTLFQLEPNGANSPHHHPDGVEFLFVFQGTINVTRIEPNTGNVYSNIVGTNMSVIFPRGHIHFQHNIGTGVARYISTLNSELPGVFSEAQGICKLPYDALLSMYALQTANAVYEMCGSNGNPGLPVNIIQYKTGVYGPSEVSSSSTFGSSSTGQNAGSSAPSSSSTGLGNYLSSSSS